MALQIAREHNDRALIAQVQKVGRDLKAALPADADKRLREFELVDGRAAVISFDSGNEGETTRAEGQNWGRRWPN